ncbi:cysteine desulfurase family protein [Neomicrococcus aestuarii]|uniref:Cysteine desulfurase NifS n=1 Tax=Neomicrococcus aestuarii TaxID=556325 RepID=A0A1L2ZL14_9MICC|nr:cysteine desulfurase family protein [Neomicrococcus aestuarii]APF39702.1 cysteine desulfurase NifS [Neomicrococcus aestuarii]
MISSSFNPPIYLDHAATTTMTPAALEAMTRELATTGNPSSLHTSGRRGHRVMEEARERLAKAVGAHATEIIFTSGGTEADNLALKGLYWTRQAEDTRRRRILLTGIEHHAVLDTAEWLEAHEGAVLEVIPVDRDGRLDVDAFATAVAHEPETIALATLMWANNEVGTVQDIAAVARTAAEHGVPLHTDAVQAFGSVPVSFKDSGAATMAISAHKIGGPVGIGALLVRRDVKLTPVQHGGGHERSLRSGTLNAAAATAFAVAAKEAVGHLEAEYERIASLRDTLIAGIEERVPEATLNGSRDANHQGERLPGNVHFTFPGCEGDTLLFLLDSVGLQTSTGSACTAGVARASHVMVAMGRNDDDARSVQRITLGHTSSQEDVDAVLSVIADVYQRSKAAGMAAGRK